MSETNEKKWLEEYMGVRTEDPNNLCETQDLIVEIGLEEAFKKAKGNIEIADLRMTQNETAQYWFSVGFKMGHRFKEFVIAQEQEKANERNENT